VFDSTELLLFDSAELLLPLPLWEAAGAPLASGVEDELDSLELELWTSVEIEELLSDFSVSDSPPSGVEIAPASGLERSTELPLFISPDDPSLGTPPPSGALKSLSSRSKVGSIGALSVSRSLLERLLSSTSTEVDEELDEDDEPVPDSALAAPPTADSGANPSG